MDNQYKKIIFCTIGNDHRDFSRFHDMLSLIANENKKIRFKFQHGHTLIKKKITNIEYFKFLNKSEFADMIKNSDIIFAHAGAGTLLSCISKKKNVFVLPRLKKYSEHLDDHQLDIFNSLLEKGLINKLEDFNYLNSKKIAINFKSTKTKMVKNIRFIVDSILDERG